MIYMQDNKGLFRFRIGFYFIHRLDWTRTFNSIQLLAQTMFWRHLGLIGIPSIWHTAAEDIPAGHWPLMSLADCLPSPLPVTPIMWKERYVYVARTYPTSRAHYPSRRGSKECDEEEGIIRCCQDNHARGSMSTVSSIDNYKPVHYVVYMSL